MSRPLSYAYKPLVSPQAASDQDETAQPETADSRTKPFSPMLTADDHEPRSRGPFYQGSSSYRWPRSSRQWSGCDCHCWWFRQHYQRLQEGYPAFRPRTLGVYLGGALFAVGWWAFIDGLVQNSLDAGAKAAGAEDWIPGVVATLGLIMLNLIQKDWLTSPDQYFSGEGSCVAGKVRLWFFISLVLLASSIGGSVAVLVVKYLREQSSSSLGVSVVTQNAFVFVSAILTWIVRNYAETEVYTI